MTALEPLGYMLVGLCCGTVGGRGPCLAETAEWQAAMQSTETVAQSSGGVAVWAKVGSMGRCGGSTFEADESTFAQLMVQLLCYGAGKVPSA